MKTFTLPSIKKMVSNSFKIKFEVFAQDELASYPIGNTRPTTYLDPFCSVSNMEEEVEHMLVLYDERKIKCGELYIATYFEKLFVPPTPNKVKEEEFDEESVNSINFEDLSLVERARLYWGNNGVSNCMKN